MDRVGKLSLVTQYINKTFDEKDSIRYRFCGFMENKNTIEINNHKIRINPECNFGERFRVIPDHSFRRAKGVIIVFDKSNRKSFECIEEFYNYCKDRSYSYTLFLLVGNKSDLENVVSDEEAHEKAKEWGTEYISASAKYYDSVKFVFETFARKIYEAKMNPRSNRSFKLQLHPKRRKKCC